MRRESPMMEQLQRYYALWRESNSLYEKWAKAQGLSLNALLILYSFFYEDGALCTQKRISQKWLIPKQTVNAVLKEFEEQGYLELSPVASDRRNKQIRLTPDGRAFARRMILKLHERELYVMEQMGLEKIRDMNDRLALFIELFRRGEAFENE